MLSYNNDENLKDMLVSEMIKHKEQDQFIKGNYSKSGEDFKGCSVGCTIDSVNKILGKSYNYYSHKSLEESVGIPEWLARLQDAIFEGIPSEEGADFSIDFLKAIPVGVNLEPVKWKFSVFLLNEGIEMVTTLGDISDGLREKVLKVMLSVLSLYENAIETGVWDKDKAEVTRSVALSARSAVWSAEAVAEAAARLAARSAEAVWSAEAVARSAAEVAYKRYAAEIIRLLQDENK